MSPIERKIEPGLAAACVTLGWTLRSQVRVGRYVLDFLVEAPSHSLAVELDGAGWHERTEDQGLKDRQRDRWLLWSFGVPTIRFLGRECVRNPQAVVTAIVQCVSGFGKERRLP